MFFVGDYAGAKRKNYIGRIDQLIIKLLPKFKCDVKQKNDGKKGMD
jgi:hypothetical protein